MSDLFELKSKARKLLALAGDSSAAPGEAENAREAAFRLMREAAITEADLREAGPAEFVVRSTRLPRVGRVWWSAIMTSLCEVVGASHYVTLMGRGRATEGLVVGTASQADAVLAMWEAVRKQSQGSSRDYVRGYAAGVGETARRARTATRASNALVTAGEAAKEWFEKDREIGKPRPVHDPGFTREALRGYRDGGKVSLDRAPQSLS